MSSQEDSHPQGGSLSDMAVSGTTVPSDSATQRTIPSVARPDQVTQSSEDPNDMGSTDLAGAADNVSDMPKVWIFLPPSATCFTLPELNWRSKLPSHLSFDSSSTTQPPHSFLPGRLFARSIVADTALSNSRSVTKLPPPRLLRRRVTLFLRKPHQRICKIWETRISARGMRGMISM
ncbi:MAG: hypothetical protein Q9183_005635 [Haloplaca sp. 2 TL-2023]